MPAQPYIRLLFLGAVTMFLQCTPEGLRYAAPSGHALEEGLHLNQSTSVKKGHYLLKGADSLDQPILTITGENITIDFNGAILQGNEHPHHPDQFTGLGILVKDGRNIHLKNLTVKGYKVALMVENVDSFQLTNANLSYNYRQHLRSTREKEDLADWMSYHHNDHDQWLRYGAAIYLKNADYVIVKNNFATGGQNALLMTNCNNGRVYNNNFSFNSGIGIGLYRSSHNQILHNRTDWCIRGFSFGIYNRGQDSAGILLYEQSSHNTIAYNSATHSGDGFFLWAGQTTMDTGQGGCNDNLVFGNDFSFASNNGVEITFSSNTIVGNRMEACDYGIWGGYSYNTTILGNHMLNNRFGIAIEHGNGNRIRYNIFEEDQTGVKLFERKTQPADWGFAQKRDVGSREYLLEHNLFNKVRTPLEITQTRKVICRQNQFYQFQRLLKTDQSGNHQFSQNRLYQNDLLGDAYPFRNDNQILNGKKYEPLLVDPTINFFRPKPFADAMETALPKGQLRGRKYILVNEWGPYDFRYPSIWLRTVDGQPAGKSGNTYTFALFGPHGNWKITGGQGFQSFSRKTGAMPATLVAETNSKETDSLRIELEFVGEQVITPFGDTLKRGTVQLFSWKI